MRPLGDLSCTLLRALPHDRRTVRYLGRALLRTLLDDISTLSNMGRRRVYLPDDSVTALLQRIARLMRTL